VHAALGERETALRYLAAWDSLGGARSWRQLDRELGWDAVRDDPRFRAIVARSGARLATMRERVRAWRADPRAADPPPTGAR
jgi:hypothetical protein